MRLGPPRRPTRVVDLINPAAVLAPAANVIMQLSLPGVGYGVLESPVDSGNVYKHPFKRARTTGTYLAAATLGHRRRSRADPRRGRQGACAGAVEEVKPVVLQRIRPAAAAVGGGLPVPVLHRPARIPLRSTRRRGRRRDLSGRQQAGHHAAGSRGDVARRPRRVRRVLEADARRAEHRPAGARAPARCGRDGVPACPAAVVGRPLQSLRHQGLSSATSSGRT